LQFNQNKTGKLIRNSRIEALGENLDGWIDQGRRDREEERVLDFSKGQRTCWFRFLTSTN